MRKRFLGLLLTAAMVACTMPMTAMAADGDSQDFKDENLVVGVWGGTIEEVLRKNVVDPMEEEYGCNIDLVLGGTSERKAKMYAEVDNPSMDVLFLNIYESAQAITDGVAQDVDPSLSNFDSLYDFAQTGGYGMSIMGLGIVYNDELVTDGSYHFLEGSLER